MKAEEARKLVEAFEGSHEGAYRLAVAVSLAVHIEPELVRALRLELFTDVDAGAEAELWFSPLVRSQTPVAMDFHPQVVGPLRQALAADQKLLNGAWETLKAFHAKAPRALRLEEELTWLALSTEKNERKIEELLLSVVEALKGGRRAGLARWANRALTALPRKARTTDAARTLSVVAGVQTGVGPVLAELPTRGLPEQLLSKVLPKNLEPVKVGVRLLKKEAAPVARAKKGASPAAKAVSGGAASLRRPHDGTPDETPMLVEFSNPPAPSSDQIEVPDTYRLLLEVSWEADAGRLHRQLSLYPDATERVEVGYGEVRIRNVAGDVHTLSLRFEYDFLLLYNRADADFASRLSERLAQQEWRGGSLGFLMQAFHGRDGVPVFIHPLESTFSLSRKVGFVVSPSSARDVRRLDALWPSRPEPPHVRDWLVPVKRAGGSFADFPGSSPAADFTDDARFEEGFRSLWKTLTGETLPLPPSPASEARVAGKVKPIRIFSIYTHEDEALRGQLEKHLWLLRRARQIGQWHDREISAGEKWRDKIDENLNAADLILVLVSPDFLASNYAYDVELKRAMERHEAGEAVVVPVILRPCDWASSPLAKLQALPSDARPVTSWPSRAEAFKNIAEGVRLIAERLQAKERGDSHAQPSAPAVSPPQVPRPPIAGFVARQGEQGRDLVGQLRELLAPERKQIIVLWGAGGVGKTTLAAEAARAMSVVFGPRVVWSSALGRADYSLSSLLDDAATQLGRNELRRLATGTKAEQVRAALAEEPALVVLDNFETIKPEEQARCVAFLRQQTPCPVLITSRGGIADAHSLTVGPMSPDEGTLFLRGLISLTSEPRVFTTTVRRQIFEAAEGNPLVMQWVVGQIDAARKPEDVFQALARGEGDTAERVFGSAFELPQLGEDGRAALLALSLFSPDASLPALAFVAGFSGDERRLDEAVKRLADLWLVKTAAEGGRLTVEGLAREMARARLSRDPKADKYRGRFVEHFESYAEARREPTAEDFNSLEAEKDNLLNAVGLAREGARWESFQRMASVIAGPRGLLSLRGYWDEAERVSRQALDAARTTGAADNVALFSTNLAFILRGRGDFAEAEQLLTESLAITQRLGDARAQANVMLELGYVNELKGNFEEARELYQHSLETYQSLGLSPGAAMVSERLGNLALAQGAPGEAEKFLSEGLRIFTESGDKFSEARSLGGLGRLAQKQGKLSEARALYERSLEIQKDLGDQPGVADNLANLGSVRRAEGEFDEAQRLLEESLSIYRRLGNQSGTSAALGELGLLFSAKGRSGEARRVYGEALEIAKALGNQPGVAAALHNSGLLAESEGDKAEAARLFKEALTIFEKLRSPQAEEVRHSLARVEGSAP